MFQYVIFDFDGTVADTKEGIMNAADYALKKFGITETAEKLHKFVGPSLWRSFPDFYGMNEADTDLAVKRYREYYEEKGIYEACLYEGMQKLLSELKKRRIPIGIASAKLEKSVVRALEYMGILDYFDCIMGSKENGEDSQKSLLINRVAAKLRAEKSKTVFIGDSITDYEGACEAGVEFIAALYDRDISEFDGCKLRYTAETVSELEELLTIETAKAAGGLKSALEYLEDLRFGDFAPKKPGNTQNKQFALALSGGGARGAYQIGVWKALLEENICISAVVGTSVGAINGALIAQGDIKKAVELWSELTPEMVFDEQKPGLMKFRDTSRLKEVIRKNVDEEKIRSSDIDFGVVSFNLTDMNGEVKFVSDIPQGEIADYVLASANHPFFERMSIGDKTFIDGGFYDNLPMKPLFEAGYKNLIAVDIREEIAKTYRDFNKAGANIIVIKHYKQLGSVLDFSNELVAERMSMGYLDAKRAFGYYYGKVYAVKKMESDSRLKINKELLTTLAENEIAVKLLKDEKNLTRIFEEINRFAQFDSQTSLFSPEFFFASCEILAQYLEVKELTEYTYDEFVLKLKENLIRIGELKQDSALLLDSIKSKLINPDLEFDEEDAHILFAVLIKSSELAEPLLPSTLKLFPRLAAAYLAAVMIMNS